MSDMPEAAPQAPDPWKSFRGVMAGTLILEAIVVLLALPVVDMVGGGLTAWSMAYLIGFAVFLVLLSGVQGRSWAVWLNLGVQLILVAGFFVYPAVGMVGVVFAIVWGIIAYLRVEVLRRQRQGRLPGQQPPQ
jgi:predicted membrane protein